MSAPRHLPLTALVVLAIAGAGDAGAQRLRSSAEGLVTATVVAPLPTVRPTGAHVAPRVGPRGSAAFEVTVVLAVARTAGDEVMVQPVSSPTEGGVLRVLTSVATERDPGAVSMAPAGRGSAVADAESLVVRLRVEGPEADLVAALPMPVAVDVVTRSADAERVHRFTIELRGLRSLAPARREASPPERAPRAKQPVAGQDAAPPPRVRR